jgi:hypothetical protein
MARSWTFGKKIAAGFALSFVLLAAIGAMAYRSIDALSQTSYSVAHTHVVLERIASLLSLLADAETGQRGYIISGDESFLEPYQAASPAIATTVNDLRRADFRQSRSAEADRPGGTPHRGEAIRAEANHRHAQKPGCPAGDEGHTGRRGEKAHG